jgi:hypothetical protein
MYNISKMDNSLHPIKTPGGLELNNRKIFIEWSYANYKPPTDKQKRQSKKARALNVHKHYI